MIPSLIARIENLETARKSNSNVPHTLAEDNIINEISERQKRVCNIMIYNLPEQRSPQADLNEVKSILKDTTTDVEEVQIVKVMRTGTNNKNGFRPLKVIFR